MEYPSNDFRLSRSDRSGYHRIEIGIGRDLVVGMKDLRITAIFHLRFCSQILHPYRIRKSSPSIE